MGQAAHRPRGPEPPPAPDGGKRIPLLGFLEKNADKAKGACARQSPRHLQASLPGRPGLVSEVAAGGAEEAMEAKWPEPPEPRLRKWKGCSEATS